MSNPATTMIGLMAAMAAAGHQADFDRADNARGYSWKSTLTKKERLHKKARNKAQRQSRKRNRP